MRKALKIKVLTTFLAWSIIFLHAVIPHIHLPEEGGCHQLMHSTCEKLPGEKHDPELTDSGNHTEKICHFQSVLFHSFNYDETFIVRETTIEFFRETITLPLFVQNTNRTISLFDSDISHLRAPPLS